MKIAPFVATIVIMIIIVAAILDEISVIQTLNPKVFLGNITALFAIIVCVFQSFDAYRSMINGSHLIFGKNDGDPKSFSSRLSAFIWGTVCLLMVIGAVFFYSESIYSVFNII